MKNAAKMAYLAAAGCAVAGAVILLREMTQARFPGEETAAAAVAIAVTLISWSIANAIDRITQEH